MRDEDKIQVAGPVEDSLQGILGELMLPIAGHPDERGLHVDDCAKALMYLARKIDELSLQIADNSAG